MPILKSHRPPVTRKDGTEVDSESVLDALTKPVTIGVTHGDLNLALEVVRMNIDGIDSVNYDSVKSRLAARAGVKPKKEKTKAQQVQDKVRAREEAAKAHLARQKGEVVPEPEEAEEEDDGPTLEQMLAWTETMPELYEAQLQLFFGGRRPCVVWWNVPDAERSIEGVRSLGDLGVAIVRELTAWYDPTQEVSTEADATTPTANTNDSASTTILQEDEAGADPVMVFLDLAAEYGIDPEAVMKWSEPVLAAAMQRSGAIASARAAEAARDKLGQK